MEPQEKSIGRLNVVFPGTRDYGLKSAGINDLGTNTLNAYSTSTLQPALAVVVMCTSLEVFGRKGVRALLIQEPF